MEETVKLTTSDMKEFVVPKKIALMSGFLRNLLLDLGEIGTESIPLSNVTGIILEKVISFCNKHQNDQARTPLQEEDFKRNEFIDPWDAEFLKVDQQTLFELIMAANYLDIKVLLDVGCKTVALMMKDKSTEELRKMFNVVNDFTPEEEEQIRKENAWCQDL